MDIVLFHFSGLSGSLWVVHVGSSHYVLLYTQTINVHVVMGLGTGPSAQELVHNNMDIVYGLCVHL